MDYFLQSLKICEDINDKQGAADALNHIAKIYYDKGQMASALQYSLKSMQISKELGSPIRIRESAQTLQKI
jgi:hypothetical protein